MTIHSPWGWLPSPPDPRDHLHPGPALSAALAGELSAEEHILSILSQGGRPTCVMHAAVQQERAERHLAGEPNPVLRSVAFGHYTTRSTHTDPTTVGGTWFRAAHKAMARFGLPPEQAYPYVIGNERQMPDGDAFRQAYDAKFDFEYLLIPFTGEKLCAAIDELLAREKTVVFGTLLTRYWRDGDFSRGPAPAPQPGEALLGGHGITIAKRDRDGNYLGPNSHGDDYGNVPGYPGWFWMTREYVQASVSQDFRYLEVRP